MGTTVRFDLPQQTQQFEVVQRRYPDIARLIEDVATADRRGPGMTRLLRPETFAAMQTVMAAYPVLWKAVCKVLPVLADPELAKVYAQFAWTYPRLEAAMAAVFVARRKNPNVVVRSPLVDPVLRARYGEARSRFPELAAVFESFVTDPVFAARNALSQPEWIPTPPRVPKPLAIESITDTFPPAGPDRPFLKCGEAFALRERNNGKYLVFNSDEGGRARVKMSDVPRAEWEFRKFHTPDAKVEGGARYLLFNRAARVGKGAFLVYYGCPSAEPDIGKWFDWSFDLENAIQLLQSDWLVECPGGGNEPPFLRFGPSSGRLLYVQDGNSFRVRNCPAFNWVALRLALPEERVSIMPCLGDFEPGERQYTPKRPESWLIEGMGSPYLFRNDYFTMLRSPYLQDATATSATVCFRIAASNDFLGSVFDKDGKPLGAAEVAQALGLHAWIAPAWIPLDGGDRSVRHIDFGTADAYALRDCRKEYLDAKANRPGLEVLLYFGNLRPETCYHYRIRCRMWDPAALLRDPASAVLGPATFVAWDVSFETPSKRHPYTGDYQSSPPPVRPTTFIAMGDFGTGCSRPNWIYEVNVSKRWTLVEVHPEFRHPACDRPGVHPTEREALLHGRGHPRVGKVHPDRWTGRKPVAGTGVRVPPGECPVLRSAGH